jgi:Flp pilus assembly protein TadD
VPSAIPARGRLAAAVAVVLVLLVVAAFSPCLGNDFVNWDDDRNFLDNPGYRGLGWRQIRWAWTTFLVGVYQPLAWMILEAEYALWGLRPRGYHLTSLVLHAVNTVVLFALTVALLMRCRAGDEREDRQAVLLGAGLAVALFAVHPLRVEAVAWVSCQPYLPCALFAMLTVLAYLRASREGPPARWGWLAGSLVLFAAALLSKAVAVSLPAVLLILDVYPLRRLGGGPGRWAGPEARKVWWEKVPFAALSLIFMGIAVVARKYNRTLVPVQLWGVSSRVAQACYGIWFYIIKTVLPTDLMGYYPLPERMDWLDPPFLLRLLATLGVSVGLFLLRRRWPGLLAAWLSYLAILAPNLGLLRYGTQLAGDRYSYVATMGLLVAMAWGLSRLLREGRRARPVGVATIAACLGAIAASIVLSRAQCRTWRTSESLWTHALAHGADRSELAHFNLGVELGAQGRGDEALAQYAEAVRLNPNYADAHNNLGATLVAKARLEEAGRELVEAIRLNPRDAKAHNNLGLALAGQGKVDEALAQYAESLRLEPGYVEALNNRAMIWAAHPEAKYRDGRRAVEAATRACELTGWKDASVLDTLAASCAEAGDFESAVRWQSRAIDLLEGERERDDFRSRLALYRAGQPYREPVAGR